MDWSIGFSPDDSAYAWDDHELIVYAVNPIIDVTSFRILSGTTKTWRASKKASDAQWPEPRKVYSRDVGAPFVYNPRLEQCILFGGKKVGPPADASGDTWLFDPSANSSKPWTLLSAKGTAKPSARWRSAAAVNSKGAFYLFGGNSDGGILGDFWSLTFQSSTDATWNRITSPGTAPPSRFNAALTASGSNLFLFGGWGTANAALGDLWMFETKWKVWALLNVASAPTPRFTYGMAPNLAVYDDAFTLLVGPGCSDDACNTVIQDLRNITDFTSSPLAAGSSFLTTRSAIFVAQQQARAYFFKTSGVDYLQLAETSCDVAVQCPGDFDDIESPDGNELNYATCCDAGRRSRYYDDDDDYDCDRKFQLPDKNFLLNALGSQHRSLVVGGTAVSATVAAGMLLAMALRRRRAVPQQTLVPDCNEGNEVLLQPEA